ncbi:hypothetical protein [Streptomyces fractus]|uniref:hypothetical protein n=1 Tax=Streptomyces fractus TaxID=641806 RepID=UPI003CF67309
MSEPDPHLTSQDEPNVRHNSLQSNGEGDDTSPEEPPRRPHEAWRHPAAIAMVLTAAGSLITALTPLLIKLT